MRTVTVVCAAAGIAACSPANDEFHAVGELASERIEISAEFDEPIVKILVAEGEAIIAGQLLLEQDDRRARTRVAEAEAAYLQATAKLDELVRGPRSEHISAARANVEGANQDLEFRQNELTRIKEIHARGLASADALDAANAALDAAQATLKLRLAQLEELLAGTTVEELTQAEQVLKQAEARLDSSRLDLDRHRLRAPVDGVVDSRLFEVGERPTKGQPVLILLDAATPHARVYVSEAVRVHIRAGTRADVRVDGMEKPLHGQVRWVASEAAFTPYFALTEHDRGRLSYVAKIDLPEQPERLPDGVPVEVDFQVANTP